MRTRICLRLVVVAVLLLARGLWADDADHCAVCGAIFGSKIYLMEDQVLHEQRRICGKCLQNFQRCYACGMPANTNEPGFLSLVDGRVICARDAKTVVLQEEDAVRVCHEVRIGVERLLSRFITLPEETVKVTMVDRVNLQGLFASAGNDYSCPNVWGYTQSWMNQGHLQHRISLMSGLPLNWLRATCAHEYSHVWLNENLPKERKETLRREANEGFCELISYLYMDAQHDESQKQMILRNAYTRGQIDLFVDSEKRYGFNEVLDWMKYGTDGLLAEAESGRVRKIEGPRRVASPPATFPDFRAAPAPVPTTLALKAIFWNQKHPLALINDHTFGAQEEGRVRLGTTNVTVRCLAIRQDAVRIRLASSGEERELFLKNQ